MTSPAASPAPRVVDDAPPIAHERVGNYALIRRIGSGGMGEVWLGRHVVSGTPGAVKRLAPHAEKRAAMAASFAREGRAVARLGHPHIVPIFELGDDYIVSGFIDGPNLSRRLRTPIDPATAMRIARQVGDALAHAHAHGIVHRDVKPSNILLDHRGTAYLADFGVAVFTGEEVRNSGVAGTPQFMAPEQRRSGPVGPAVDQYALGRTLLEMLVGAALPLESEAALRELPASLPAALREAVTRATSAAPGDRYPTMTDFVAALSAIDLGAAAPPQRRAPEIRERSAFAWAAHPVRVVDVSPEIRRSDYRLSDLVAAGVLPAASVTSYLNATGLADVGWAMWARTSRLGPLEDPSALARASEVAILLHGWAHNRDVWAEVAMALCRDNAQAVVLAPDVHGFGETRWAGIPTVEQASALAIARAADDWRRLLGLGAVPTALVGHSMSGLAMLSVSDDDAGALVARIAINPLLASYDPRVRRNMRMQRAVSLTLGRIHVLRAAYLRRSAASMPQDVLAPPIVQLMYEQTLAMPTRTLANTIAGIAGTPPVRGRHRRIAVIACLDDAFIAEDALERMIHHVGIQPAQVHRMINGGHHPHIESATHPEWSARNRADVTRVIDGMLITAAEPTRSGVTAVDGTTFESGSVESDTWG